MHQTLCQCCDQRQTLVLTQRQIMTYGASVLPKATALLSRHKLEKEYTALAIDKAFRDPIDFLLCLAKPEFLKLCRNFYSKSGPNLRDMKERDTLSKIDIGVCNYLMNQNCLGITGRMK